MIVSSTDSRASDEVAAMDRRWRNGFSREAVRRVSEEARDRGPEETSRSSRCREEDLVSIALRLVYAMH